MESNLLIAGREISPPAASYCACENCKRALEREKEIQEKRERRAAAAMHALGSRGASEYFRETKTRQKEFERRPGKNARQLMRRVTQNNKPIFFTKLSSERIVSYCSIHQPWRYTGSSINDLLKKKHNELQTEEKNKIFAAAQASLFPIDNAIADREQCEDANDHCNQTDQSRDPRRVARGIDGKKRRIHVLSPRSKAKIRAKITEFFAVCKRTKKQCTFLTLTFISDVADRLAMKILNTFLTSVRQEVGLGFQYIRVAERQKNGRIHFHLILDRAINIIRFNSLWVLTQYNAGLLAMNRQLDMFITREEIIERHEKLMRLYQDYKAAREVRNEKGMREITEKLKAVAIGKLLNPVDIKKVSSAGALAGYLTKYVTKNDAEFNCLAWSCSRGISRMFTHTVVPFEVWDESKSEVNSFITEDGELRQPIPYQDKKGMSVTIKIFNRRHFDQYLEEMRTVNKWILSGEIILPQVPRYSIDEYLQRVHNYTFN